MTTEIAPPEIVSIGPYRLFMPLKKGGMARVYLAVHVEAPHQILAIKTLLPELADKSAYRDMFATEGKVGRLLEHPHVVRTLDHGHLGGTDYIVMEYLAGADLSALLRALRKQGRRLPVPVALTLALWMVEGLQHAHERVDDAGRPLEIVNRDVSPGNVMITAEGDCKLIDFGIAQTTVDVRSQIGSVKGKISHMSPEQVRGLPVDQRSDLFSLGTVLYQMLTGVNVFHGDGDFDTMERVRRAEAPPPSHHNPSLDPALDALVASTLAPQPHDRPQDARTLAASLRAYMADHGITPRQAPVAATLAQILGPKISAVAAEVAAAHRNALTQMGLFEAEGTAPREVSRQTLQEALPAPPPPAGASTQRLVWAALAGALCAMALWLVARWGR